MPMPDVPDKANDVTAEESFGIDDMDISDVEDTLP